MHVLFAGAQSDSEITEGGSSTAASDRGYTSDSELYEGPSSRQQHQHQHQHRASPELALRPVPDNGSWMLVGDGEFGAAVVCCPWPAFYVHLNSTRC